MSVKNSHVLVHMQVIDMKRYIRIVCLADTQSYFDELKEVYGGDYRDDSNITIYYNCGEAYERLLYDLKFRKFKGMETVSPSLWCVNDASLDSNWFMNVYIPLITAKMVTYIEDMEDVRPYFSTTPDLISFDNLNTEKYIKMDIGQTPIHGVCYTFNGCEVTTNGYSVINNDHIESLILMYIKNHSTVDGKSMFTPHDSKDDPIEIYTTEESRGLYISKSTRITPKDALDIFQFLDITHDTLTNVATSSSFKKYIDKFTLHSAQQCEYDPFVSYYSFIESECHSIVPTQGDLLTVHETLVKTKGPDLLENIRMLCGKGLRDAEVLPTQLSIMKIDADSTIQPDEVEEKEVFFYTNLFNQGVVAFSIDIQYLPEFIKISNFIYTSPLITSIIDIVNKSPKEAINLLKDLKNLDGILGILSVTETMPVDSVDKQRKLTQAYVERYKKNDTETLASVVIDNVFAYLIEHNFTHINKNQIGKDLVELGVKKTRKAKGYVYGIQDSSVVV